MHLVISHCTERLLDASDKETMKEMVSFTNHSIHFSGLLATYARKCCF